jgi:uncharacterized protein (DUF58 family)
MSASTTRAASSLLDPAALMSIRNLELRARTVVEGFWHGLHRSPYHGFSVEFTEYRPYTPGDDPRYLDWKLAGRTDRYFVKKFEDETNLRCHLLVDLSRSMSFGSHGYSKADYARTLAATLAWFLAHQGDAIGLMTFDGAVREYLPARHRPGHLRHLMLALEKPAEGRGTDLAAPLRRVVELARKRGLIVLISDLFAPLASLAGALALLTAGGHEVIVFQVLDPAELNFDFHTAARFEDLETGRDVFLDPALARENYVRRLGAHLEALRETCQGLGIMRVQVSSTQPLETVLFDFLKARTNLGKTIRRRTATA